MPCVDHGFVEAWSDLPREIKISRNTLLIQFVTMLLYFPFPLYVPPQIRDPNTGLGREMVEVGILVLIPSSLNSSLPQFSISDFITGFERGSTTCSWPTRSDDQGGKCMEYSSIIR